MGRKRDTPGGTCGGCGDPWPCARPYWTQSFALDDLLDERTEAGMIVAVALSQAVTREAAVQLVGQAAQREGKSFQESLRAYFLLYTDGQIPSVEPYRGRVASRGVQAEPIQPVETEQPAPVVRETLFEEVQRPISGRVCSRGV